VPAIAGKAKAAGMAHSDCGWTCGAISSDFTYYYLSFTIIR